jgi:secreted trypsin-like serine protease
MILVVLCLFLIFDVTAPIDYTCDPHATCGCSKQSTVILSKIIGGEPASIPHSWGWIASLRRDDMHSCGASVLTSWHVITAAHCVNDITSLSRLSLNFGIINLATIGLLRNVTKMYIHPLFDQRLLTNDLAILRLHKPINLTNSTISSICLPETSEFNLKLAEYPPIGENLVAIGWGITEPFAALPSTVLRQVTLQAMASTDESCTNTINDDVVQFCAGFSDGGKDTCKGDSGGPLMLFKNGCWQLIGITSYGGICGSPDFAGVYTRVAYYDSYIEEIINSNDSSIEQIINSNDTSIQEIITSNDTYIPDPKQLGVDQKSSSNTETFYQKSKIESVFIFVFIVYRKLFFRN